VKVRDYLSIPYVVEAAPVERENGEWVRQLRYPELGDFRVETIDVETGLRELERWRIQEIVRLLKSGQLPPTPRAPLNNVDPEWQARALGVWELVSGLFNLEATEVAERR
jgi:hypothetical protein